MGALDDVSFSVRLAVFVLDAFHANRTDPGLDADHDQLTPRERDVLRLVAAGYTSAEVGERLPISPRSKVSRLSPAGRWVGAVKLHCGLGPVQLCPNDN